MNLAAAGLAAAAGLTVTACGGVPNPVGTGDVSPFPASPSPTASAAGAVSSRPLAPLTGLPAASAAAAARPAVALVVAGTHPQGLAPADLVFEEMTAPVRYIAIYQSGQAANVGPITAIQVADRGILPVLHPRVGYDGATAPYVIKLLDKTKIIDASYARYPALYTATPAGLTTSTQAVWRAVRGGSAPPAIFPYRGTGAAGNTLASGGLSSPRGARVVIPGFATQDWTFGRHADRWTLTSGGPRVQAANVIVQTVTYKQAPNARHRTLPPQAELTGTGRAEVLSGSAGSSTGGGTAAAGTWSRLHPGQITNYFDSKGALMAFQPGPTWVILAPPGTQVSLSG